MEVIVPLLALVSCTELHQASWVSDLHRVRALIDEATARIRILRTDLYNLRRTYDPFDLKVVVLFNAARITWQQSRQTPQSGTQITKMAVVASQKVH